MQWFCIMELPKTWTSNKNKSVAGCYFFSGFFYSFNFVFLNVFLIVFFPKPCVSVWRLARRLSVTLSLSSLIFSLHQFLFFLESWRRHCVLAACLRGTLIHPVRFGLLVQGGGRNMNEFAPPQPLPPLFQNSPIIFLPL